ncbi:MAG TPA: anti-sigma factor [Chitinophagaceae bacterium]|nr:anti-sigma factor [Chitinophagaceae bacterium]
MNKEDIISSGLLELYALGIASPEEKIQVERGLAEYPELRHELSAIEDSLETYAHAYTKQPPARIKEKIFEEISNEAAKKEPADGNHQPSAQILYRIPAFFKLAAAAMLLLLIGSIALSYLYYNRYKEADEKYNAASDQLQQANEKLKENDEANAAMKHELNLMSDKNALPVVLNGTPQAPDALAKIYWMKNNGDIYIDPTNLPPAPEGKQYQFWAIIDGKPIDGGMIRTENGVYRIQKMKSFGHADAFAITLENSGGGPVPHGKTYAMAKIL